MKGVNDSTAPEELKKWLKKGDIVRIIPHWRNKDARIVSDVWLGNIHINRQVSSYKKDNLIQTFNYWHDTRKDYNIETIKIKAEERLKEAFNTAWDLIPNTLKKTVTNWTEYSLSKKKDGPISIGIDKMLEVNKQQTDQMITEFNNWKEKQR